MSHPARKPDGSPPEPCGPRATAPSWAQRPGETFAEYLERFDAEIQTPEERARGEGGAWGATAGGGNRPDAVAGAIVRYT